MENFHINSNHIIKVDKVNTTTKITAENLKEEGYWVISFGDSTNWEQRQNYSYSCLKCFGRAGDWLRGTCNVILHGWSCR